MISINDLEEITDSGEIRIEQYKMKIKFWISEIEEIQKMKTYHISRYYLAECNELSVNSECKKRNNWVDCFMCKELKHEEYYVCGFIANGRDYVIVLPTGISIPITEKFFLELEEYRISHKINDNGWIF